RAWSLQVFIYLLAYDAVRILIWLDHMGLRVATLVNLSFLGVDKLERWLARVLAPAATARCIPEGVKRFTTWGPLLIPYYIPRGKDWDQAWSTAEALRSHARGGLLASFHALTVYVQPLFLVGEADDAGRPSVGVSAGSGDPRRTEGLSARSGDARRARAWPVIGNVPGEMAGSSRFERDEQCLRVSNTHNGLRTTVEISL